MGISCLAFNPQLSIRRSSHLIPFWARLEDLTQLLVQLHLRGGHSGGVESGDIDGKFAGQRHAGSFARTTRLAIVFNAIFSEHID